MTLMGWLAIGVVLLVVLILAEGRRQRRKGLPAPRGTSLIRSGMLELQTLLEPEKKIELLIKKEDRTVQYEYAGPDTAGKTD